MKEEFLHYVWKYQLIKISALRTTKHEVLSIISTGIHNHDAGPDFLNSKIRISNQLWIGNVEIHLKSSDWYWHQHENDENYDAVILHVVWDDDVEVFMKNDQPLPTLSLKGLVSIDLLNNYKKLIKNQEKWIPCQNEINEVDPFKLNNWLERLYFERLERKSIFIQKLLDQTNNDWDAVLFVLLAKNFGLNKNGEAFYQFARSLPFSVIRKVANDSRSLSALFFGQAGFLEENFDGLYYLELKKEYDYLKKKFRLKPIDKKLFQFFRMRPSNFPTIRLAQLASVYHKSLGLFSELMKCDSVNQMYSLFGTQLDGFWKTHFTFSKSSKESHKSLTKAFINLLIINTIVPLKFAYQKAVHEFDEENFLDLIQSIKPEKNKIVSKFEELGLEAEDALKSQSMIELKNNYCAKKLCLQCTIGKEILK